MPPVITVLIVFVSMYVVYELGMRYVLTYRFTDEDVRAVLFGVVPVSIQSYRFIKEVRTTSFFEGQFVLAWRVPNRLTGRGVMIFSKGNLLWLSVFYTPEDPEAFARELRRRVYQQTGRLPLGS